MSTNTQEVSLMTTKKTGVPDDFISHQASWRSALEQCVKTAPEATHDMDDKAYWQHELTAFDRAYAELNAKPSSDDELTNDQKRIKLLEKVLGDVKVRIAFMGWPTESMWQASSGNWIPDWRRECAWIEHALHGSPVNEDDLAALVSFPANDLPVIAAEVPRG